MRDSAYRISLDIHEVQSQVSLPIKLGDTARRIYINLTENGMPYIIEKDCLAVFSGIKSDGKKILNNCTIEDNRIRYDITKQTSSTEGVVEVEIILYGSDDAKLCSPRFDLIVDDRAIGDDVISEDEKNVFDSYALAEVERIQNEEERVKGYNNINLEVKDSADYVIVEKTNKDGSKEETVIAKGKNSVSPEHIVYELNKDASDAYVPSAKAVVKFTDNVAAELSQELAVERTRITNLSTLQEGSTTGDAELIDARVGADGTVYSSVGESVRTQVSNLDNKIPTVVSEIQMFNPNDTSMVFNGFNGASGIETNNNTRFCFVECEPNTKYTVSILSNYNRFVIFTTHEIPANGVQAYQKNDNSTQGMYDVEQNNRIYKMIETDTDDKYLCVFYFNASTSSPTEEECRNSILINKGHIVYDYKPFFTTDIETLKTHKELSTVACYGAEILTSNVTLNDGWSGDNINGFIHEEGYNRPLVFHTTNLRDGEYILSVTSVTEDVSVNSLFTVDVGGAKSGRMYEGEFSEHTYLRGFKTNNLANVTISIDSNFVGTLKNISLKKIYSKSVPSKITTGNGELEAHIEYNSVYLGNNNANKCLPSAENNVGVGVNALASNLSGYWNTAIGKDALQKNTIGSRNIAIGYIAMRENTNGHRNVAIGTFALLENTTGYHNIAIGADCLQRLTTGDNNIGLGVNTLANNNSSENVGVGYSALGNNTTGNKNVAIGTKSGNGNITGARNTFIGANSDGVDSITDSIAIGYNAKATKNNQCVIGNENMEEVILGNKKLLFNDDGTVTWTTI